MAARQLDLIMSQVRQLSASDQLQIIKRVADLLEHAEQSPRSEEQLAAMAADPAMQRELRQIEVASAGAEMDKPEPGKSENQPVPIASGMTNGEVQRPDAVGERARAASLRDFTADRQWLADHRDEYAGQWVALKYGQLISHGKDHLAVHREAKAAGHVDALLVLVEPSDAPPFIL